MKDDFTLTAHFPVAASRVYSAWLDSKEHAAMTGGEASIEPKEGTEFTAWDGYIRGTLTKLVENREITQRWRTTNFGDADEDSVVQVLLEDTPDGCRLELKHTMVPEDDADYYNGWQDCYFVPMADYFTSSSG